MPKQPFSNDTEGLSKISSGMRRSGSHANETPCRAAEKSMRCKASASASDRWSSAKAATGRSRSRRNLLPSSCDLRSRKATHISATRTLAQRCKTAFTSGGAMLCNSPERHETATRTPRGGMLTLLCRCVPAGPQGHQHGRAIAQDTWLHI